MTPNSQPATPATPDSTDAASTPGALPHVVCYLDFISPYAYLAFERLPEALAGIGHSLSFKPVLLGALLRQHGQLGPAEIPAKRSWTYRHVLWLAQEAGIEMQMPASHPFAPLPWLRLALATSQDGEVSRYVADRLFQAIWRGGAEAGDAARVAQVASQLDRVRPADGDAVKAQLKSNTEEALARGVFGVPSFEHAGRLFFGLDALPMLRASLEGAAWFDQDGWRLADQRPGLQRPQQPPITPPSR